MHGKVITNTKYALFKHENSARYIFPSLLSVHRNYSENLATASVPYIQACIKVKVLYHNYCRFINSIAMYYDFAELGFVNC